MNKGVGGEVYHNQQRLAAQAVSNGFLGGSCRQCAGCLLRLGELAVHYRPWAALLDEHLHSDSVHKHFYRKVLYEYAFGYFLPWVVCFSL